MLRKLLARLADERGMALVLALAAMLALSIIAGSTIYYTTASQRESSQSRTADTAYRLAEAGINNAMAVLGDSQTSALDSTALPNDEASASTQDFSGGTSEWWGTFDSTTKIWTLYGKGIATGGAGVHAQAIRQLSATMQVSYSYKQPVNAQAWNFVYLSATGTSTSCDATIYQNAKIDAPLYVDGNLCLQENGHIEEDLISPKLPVSAVVKGNIEFDNNSSIGISNSNTITGLYVGGKCGKGGLTSLHTCSSTTDAIYVGTGGLNHSTPAVSAPVVDWVNDGWYTNASPGPNHPCANVTGTPPLFDGGRTAPFDTEQDISGTYPNGSLPTTQNLTPSQSYTCQTGYGELSWNASTHTMTVNGVIYIDGNVSIGDGSVDEYNGQATLYASGYITVTGSMCGKRTSDNSACDFTNWDPNTEMWILAAHGNNGSGYSVVFPNNSTWEGGIYATNSINMLNNASIEGPIIGSSVAFNQKIVLKPFPIITSIPEGAPGNPNIYAQPNPPGGYSG